MYTFPITNTSFEKIQTYLFIQMYICTNTYEFSISLSNIYFAPTRETICQNNIGSVVGIVFYPEVKKKCQVIFYYSPCARVYVCEYCCLGKVNNFSKYTSYLCVCEWYEYLCLYKLLTEINGTQGMYALMWCACIIFVFCIQSTYEPGLCIMWLLYTGKVKYVCKKLE